MKTLLVMFALMVGFSPTVKAAEDCPVSKISLARGLACEVYQLALKYEEKNSQIDAICLKLGRVSAILRRTQGQLKEHPTAPIPPVEWKQRAIEMEGFCGVGNDTTLPRGLTHPEYLTQEPNGLKEYMKGRLAEQNRFIAENKDPEGLNCPAPTALTEKSLVDCGSRD